MITCTYNNDEIVSMTQPVNELRQWAQSPHKRTGRIADGEIHYPHAGRSGRMSSIPFEHPMECSMDQINKKIIRNNRFNACYPFVRLKNRAHVETTLDRTTRRR